VPFKVRKGRPKRGRTRFLAHAMVEKWPGMGAMGTIAGGTLFFGKTYGEALGLVVEARDYLERHEREDGLDLAPIARLQMCAETLRLTARLTRIMAWLLAQRAVASGEMSVEEALSEPLDDFDICSAGAEHEEIGLPPRLGELLGRSRLLYGRVARLDALARRALTLS
jgi:regulator of CtrA degradation